MPLQIEWRSRADGEDAILAVEGDSNSVLEVWEVDPAMLTDFLNDMTELDNQKGQHTRDIGQKDPDDWGKLVIARSESGDVISVDPELYWGGVAYWFRARGDDPHLWRSRHR
jgi:hypothetical protein